MINSMIDNYIPRLVDSEVVEKLANFGAVNIVGCKWCGKTRTAKHFANSAVELENPDSQSIVPLIKSQPSLALKGDTPRLIDEWQDIPQVWDAVRYEVDNSTDSGRFILTGSSVPYKEKPKHSGAGRIADIEMRPMSLYESGDSNGAVSISSLFAKNTTIEGEAHYNLEDIAYFCIRGGWPRSIVTSPLNPALLAKEYLRIIINREEGFSELEYYDPTKMQALLRSIARNTATPFKNTTLLADISENTGFTISDVTLANYLSVLERVYLIESIEAWCPKLRSKTEIRTTRKRYLVDPSLAAVSLYANVDDLITDGNTFGLIFESLALRDLKSYASALGADLHYYRDASGLECDAIIHLPNGNWGAIEIKLGSNDEALDEGASNLLNLASLVDASKMHAPSFLMVLSGDAKYAYRRKDGAYIVPIGCLKP